MPLRSFLRVVLILGERRKRAMKEVPVEENFHPLDTLINSFSFPYQFN